VLIQVTILIGFLVPVHPAPHPAPFHRPVFRPARLPLVPVHLAFRAVPQVPVLFHQAPVHPAFLHPRPVHPAFRAVPPVVFPRPRLHFARTQVVHQVVLHPVLPKIFKDIGQTVV
jgi:hypothetical protein